MKSKIIMLAMLFAFFGLTDLHAQGRGRGWGNGKMKNHDRGGDEGYNRDNGRYRGDYGRYRGHGDEDDDDDDQGEYRRVYRNRDYGYNNRDYRYRNRDYGYYGGHYGYNNLGSILSNEILGYPNRDYSYRGSRQPYRVYNQQLPPGQAKKIYGYKSAKQFAPGQQKKAYSNNRYYQGNNRVFYKNRYETDRYQQRRNAETARRIGSLFGL